MGAHTEGSNDPVGRPHVRLRVLKAIAFSGLVMLLAVLAFSVSQWRSVEAATLASQHSNATLTDPAGNGMEQWVTALGVMAQGTLANYLVSLEAGEAADAGPQAAASEDQTSMETVWSATLTVGMAADSTTTYLGYSSDPTLESGGLDVETFEHEGVTYTVEDLFIQQVGSFRQLVLYAGNPLPEYMIFTAGDEEFDVADSNLLGLHQNIHAWRLDSDLGWEEGQTVEVSLLCEKEFMTQELEPSFGPDPVDLPEGTAFSETLAPGDMLTGELTSPGQFLTYKLLVEPGKKYRIDMRGADTGDGTLSDPWISGIKGAFDTEEGVQMQPVWYDEQGRSSTEIVWPSGEVFQLDQYGRFYTVVTDSEGEPVLRPLMGANDDGGEGFNARLYLVNFPAREYVIVVSGSPNPSPTGTFTLSLTDVSTDDYSADSTNAGTLVVDGSVSGELEAPGDVDWFAIELTADTRYEVAVRGSATGDGTLPQALLAGIYDSEGVLAEGTASDDEYSHGPRNSTLDFTPESDGTYYIAVASQSPYKPNRSSIPAGTYAVSVTTGS